jgi:lysophospholipase L1-like esterase
VPIPEQYVITTDEKQFIANAIANYNSIIKKEADLHNLAYVDMKGYMTNLFKGYSYNGIKYTADYVAGGAYSLDGIHPTQRGYALLANHIITTINSFYKSTVPLTDANKYPGIVFP